MSRIVFTRAAREELLEAQSWYERESSGLGAQFLSAVDAAVERISAGPLQFPVVHRDVRRALLRRFPHALFFVIDSDESITVIACFHASRSPLRWQKRM